MKKLSRLFLLFNLARRLRGSSLSSDLSTDRVNIDRGCFNVFDAMVELLLDGHYATSRSSGPL